MNLVRRHRMTKDGAKEWVEEQLPNLLNQFSNSVLGAQHHWEGDIMHFSLAVKVAGRFQGTLRVTDTDYVMDVPFGFVRRILEGKARAAIERWLDGNLV
jgi:hypothetical protein